MILRSPRQLASHSLRANRSAFTLLEVLVVVAIIVMLAGIGGYYLMAQYEAAKLSTAKINANGLAQECEKYKLNNGEYPQNIQALTVQQPNGGPPLVPPDKILDPWNKPFQVDPTGRHNQGLKADVFTTAPDGRIIGNFSN